MFISLLFKLRKFSTYFEYSNNEIICKFVGKTIAKRHATILERLNFHLPSLSLSRPFPVRFHTPPFHYSLLLCPSLSGLFLSHFPTTPTLFPLYSSIPSRSSSLARTHARNTVAGSAH